MLVSCNKPGNEKIDHQNEETDHPSEVIDNQNEVNEFKALLSKQDLSPFYERMFSSIFKQDYVSYTNSYGEEERNVDFFRYLGNGAYGYYYSVTREEYEEIMAKENVNPFDFITKGPGNYTLIQSANINTFSSELVDEIEKSSTRDFKFYQRLFL